MIKSVSQTDNKQNTNVKNNKKNKYKDPLEKKWLKQVSYSNEVGTAISEIYPRIGAAMWAPTFMYLGADIYDKYKNDKNKYNPNAKRGIERAIYQGIMSLVVLPLVICGGQKLVSPIEQKIRGGISINAKDAVFRHTREVIDQSVGESFNDADKFKQIILTTLNNKVDARKNEKKTRNLFKKFIDFITDRYPMVESDRKELLAFAEKNAEKVFEIKTALLTNNPKTHNVPKKTVHKYHSIMPAMKKIYGHDYANHALRSALKEYQTSLIFKNKILKTLGGFAAIAICSSPVNLFVEKTLMEKYIDPGIDGISKEFVNSSNMKNVFNELHTKKQNQDMWAKFKTERQKLKESTLVKNKNEPS